MICDFKSIDSFFLIWRKTIVISRRLLPFALPWYMCQNWILSSFCHCSTVVSLDAFVRWVAMPYHDTFFGFELGDCISMQNDDHP